MSKKLIYFCLTLFFLISFVFANLLGGKIFPFPVLKGFFLTSGTLPYPITFIISDLITEIWGRKKAIQMVLLSFFACIAALCFQFLFYSNVRLSAILVLASLFAFAIGHLVDISLFQWIRQLTKGRFLWLRNQLSTYASQLIDTLIINSIVLFWGLGLTFHEAVPVMLGNLIYKFFFAIAAIPIFYVCVFFLRGYEKNAPFA